MPLDNGLTTLIYRIFDDFVLSLSYTLIDIDQIIIAYIVATFYICAEERNTYTFALTSS